MRRMVKASIMQKPFRSLYLVSQIVNHKWLKCNDVDRREEKSNPQIDWQMVPFKKYQISGFAGVRQT